MKHILYLITRDDGQQYVGITIDYRIKQRMAQHRLSPKFKDHKFTFEILLEDDNRKIIEDAEIKAVEKYDTFFNGLNSTFSGKGQHHNSSKFNTLGFKFSKKSREKMSISAKTRAAREGFAERSRRSKIIWSDLSRREALSKQKIGKRSKLRKLSETELLQLQEEFKKFEHKSIGTKSKNGKVLTKHRLFSNIKGEQLGLTGTGMYGYVSKFSD